jgi:hypothetical protein
MRGASKGVREVGQVRRPRACLASTPPGGAGTPPPGQYDPGARSSLTVGGLSPGRKHGPGPK